MMAIGGNFWFSILSDLENFCPCGNKSTESPYVRSFWILRSRLSLSSQCLTALSCWLGSWRLQIPAYLGAGTLKILPWPCCPRHRPLPHPQLPNPLLRGHLFHSVAHIPHIPPPIHLFQLPSPPGQRSSNNFLLLTYLPLFPLPLPALLIVPWHLFVPLYLYLT